MAKNNMLINTGCLDIAAHKDIPGGIMTLGPGMDADMGFSKDSHTRYTPTGRKMMAMHMQKGGVTCDHSPLALTIFCWVFLNPVCTYDD